MMCYASVACRLVSGAKLTNCASEFFANRSCGTGAIVFQPLHCYKLQQCEVASCEKTLLRIRCVKDDLGKKRIRSFDQTAWQEQIIDNTKLDSLIAFFSIVGQDKKIRPYVANCH